MSKNAMKIEFYFVKILRIIFILTVSLRNFSSNRLYVSVTQNNVVYSKTIYSPQFTLREKS